MSKNKARIHIAINSPCIWGVIIDKKRKSGVATRSGSNSWSSIFHPVIQR
ncbi:MAG: hypothetical protein GX799_11570 [Crenarchaeota archaeon]|nr:hypothetical protein [Thermoproteota archaeon]